MATTQPSSEMATFETAEDFIELCKIPETERGEPCTGSGSKKRMIDAVFNAGKIINDQVEELKAKNKVLEELEAKVEELKAKIEELKAKDEAKDEETKVKDEALKAKDEEIAKIEAEQSKTKSVLDAFVQGGKKVNELYVDIAKRAKELEQASTVVATAAPLAQPATTAPPETATTGAAAPAKKNAKTPVTKVHDLINDKEKKKEKDERIAQYGFFSGHGANATVEISIEGEEQPWGLVGLRADGKDVTAKYKPRKGKESIVILQISKLRRGFAYKAIGTDVEEVFFSVYDIKKALKVGNKREWNREAGGRAPAQDGGGKRQPQESLGREIAELKERFAALEGEQTRSCTPPPQWRKRQDHYYQGPCDHAACQRPYHQGRWQHGPPRWARAN